MGEWYLSSAGRSRLDQSETPVRLECQRIKFAADDEGHAVARDTVANATQLRDVHCSEPMPCNDELNSQRPAHATHLHHVQQKASTVSDTPHSCRDEVDVACNRSTMHAERLTAWLWLVVQACSGKVRPSPQTHTLATSTMH